METTWDARLERTYMEQTTGWRTGDVCWASGSRQMSASTTNLRLKVQRQPITTMNEFWSLVVCIFFQPDWSQLWASDISMIIDTDDTFSMKWNAKAFCVFSKNISTRSIHIRIAEDIMVLSLTSLPHWQMICQQTKGSMLPLLDPAGSKHLAPSQSNLD